MLLKQAAMAYPTMSSFFVIVSMAAWSGAAAASGYALIEQSGSGLGNAYAGVTANAEDASTIFFNPAGMALLHGKQFAVAGNLLGVTSQFSDTSSVAATGRALGTADNSAKSAWIPSGYFVAEVTPKLHFGTGIGTPFGASSEYQPGWIGRYQTLQSNIATVNVNPSFSYQMNDAFSIGAGLDYQRFNATLTNARILAPTVDGVTTFSGSDDAWGYNIGGLIRLADSSRIGVSYRSAIQFRLSGTAYTSSALPIPLTNVSIPVTADIKTPDTLSIGYFKRLNSKWDVMANLMRTGWGDFNELRVIQVSTGATIALTPENWNNTWRVAVGANHHYNEQWTVRAGLAYDQSPVSDAFRTARIPDSDRTWLSLGGQYKTGKGSVLDFGYAHLFVQNSTINRNIGGVDVASTALYARLAGSFGSNADILSVQYTYGF
jgi:long-chain fatty acid transport protein